MLKNTFCHVPGVGIATERRLWDSGLHSWECLGSVTPESLTRGKVAGIRRHIEASFGALRSGNPGFFAASLSPDQHWRLFPEFRGRIAYLDIETNGMGTLHDHITTVSLYDGQTVSTYIHGQNLHRFPQDIERYQVIVTYNGKCFDVPFIRNTLHVPMDHVHIDLRYVLKSLGYSGGLKGCEKRFGIDREELDGVDGFFAVLLWEEFKRNRNGKALETLLAYNILDTVNLEFLMVSAYNLKVEATPFGSALKLPLPEPPAIPFTPDRHTLASIRQRLTHWP